MLSLYTSSLSSRLEYPTTHSTSPLGCLKSTCTLRLPPNAAPHPCRFFYLCYWQHHLSSPQLPNPGVITDSSFLHTPHPICQQILLALSSKSKYKWIISHTSTATIPVQTTFTSCLKYWNSFWSTLAFTLFLYCLFSIQQPEWPFWKWEVRLCYCSTQNPPVPPHFTWSRKALHSRCFSNFITKPLSLTHSSSFHTGFTSLLVLEQATYLSVPQLLHWLVLLPGTLFPSYLHGFSLNSFKTVQVTLSFVFKSCIKLQIVTFSLLQSFLYPQMPNLNNPLKLFLTALSISSYTI